MYEKSTLCNHEIAGTIKSGKQKDGFTLIELSIVLVIIGLIVGGVLVGQDLIKAAEVRGQISQIEKFNTAVNTFRGKYGYLQGDIPDPYASNFGLASRNTPRGGVGDGNGVLEGAYNWVQTNVGMAQGDGENSLFWVDLSTTGLIDGNFTLTNLGGGDWGQSTMNRWFPAAKLGGASYIYTYSWNSVNYFGLSAATYIGSNGRFESSVGISVEKANAVDKKIDDGLPQSGKVLAFYVDNTGADTAGPTFSGSPGSGYTPLPQQQRPAHPPPALTIIILPGQLKPIL